MIDLQLGRIGDPRGLALVLNQVPGVVENGLFVDICDRLVIMDKGEIVAEGSPATLIAEHSSREVLELRFPVKSMR